MIPVPRGRGAGGEVLAPGLITVGLPQHTSHMARGKWFLQMLVGNGSGKFCPLQGRLGPTGPGQEGPAELEQGSPLPVLAVPSGRGPGSPTACLVSSGRHPPFMGLCS